MDGGHIRLRQYAVERYNLDPAICRHCKKIIPTKEGVRPSETRLKLFCDHSCAASHNDRFFPKKKRTRRCKMCGSHDLPITSRFCDKCKDERKRGTRPTDTLEQLISRPYLADRHPSWRFAQIRAIARDWNRDRPKVCQSCGYSRHVEYAHIRALSNFPVTATLGEINGEANVLVLCRNCHWEFDHKQLTVSQILSSRIGSVS